MAARVPNEGTGLDISLAWWEEEQETKQKTWHFFLQSISKAMVRAATAAPSGTLLIPCLEPGQDMISVASVPTEGAKQRDPFDPNVTDNAVEAVAHAVLASGSSQCSPTPLTEYIKYNANVGRRWAFNKLEDLTAAVQISPSVEDVRVEKPVVVVKLPLFLLQQTEWIFFMRSGATQEVWSFEGGRGRGKQTLSLSVSHQGGGPCYWAEAESAPD